MITERRRKSKIGTQQVEYIFQGGYKENKCDVVTQGYKENEKQN